MPQDPFSFLPKDTQYLVLSFLKREDFASSAKVCGSWKRTVDSYRDFFNQKLFKIIDDILESSSQEIDPKAIDELKRIANLDEVDPSLALLKIIEQQTSRFSDENMLRKGKQLIRELLLNNADPNRENAKGLTPLMLLVNMVLETHSSWDTQIAIFIEEIELLIANDANAYKKDSKGLTIFDYIQMKMDEALKNNDCEKAIQLKRLIKKLEKTIQSKRLTEQLNELTKGRSSNKHRHGRRRWGKAAGQIDLNDFSIACQELNVFTVRIGLQRDPTFVKDMESTVFNLTSVINPQNIKAENFQRIQEIVTLVIQNGLDPFCQNLLLPSENDGPRQWGDIFNYLKRLIEKFADDDRGIFCKQLYKIIFDEHMRYEQANATVDPVNDKNDPTTHQHKRQRR